MEITKTSTQTRKAMSQTDFNEHFLSKMFLHHPVPTAILSEDFTYKYCNKAYSESLGFSRQFLLQKHVSEQFKTLEKEELEKGKRTWELTEFRDKCFDIKITPIDASDIRSGYYITLSERLLKAPKKTQTSLVETFHSVFIYAKIGIALLNDKGQVLKANQAIQEFLGYSEQEFQERTFIDLTYPEDINKDVEQYRLLIDGQIDDYTMEKRYIRKDGQIVWGSLSVSLERDTNGKVVHVIGMVEDITEKKKRLRQIKKSEERLHLAIEGTRAGLWDWDIRSNKITTNDRYKEMIGYSNEEVENIVSVDWNEVHPEDIGASKEAVQKHFKGENEFYEFEGRVKHKKGNWIWFLIKGKISERDENGVPIRMTGTRVDISKRKEAEIELQKYRTQLQEMVDARTMELKEINQELEAFAYSISHDLRTPLRHIQGFSKLLERSLKLSEDEKEFFGHIIQGTSKMSTMIDALLSFSRLGRKVLEKSSVNLNELTKEVINDLLLFDKKRAIEWRISDLPVVKGDVNLLQMVFENLIANALKFSRKEAQPVIEIGTLPSENGKNTIYIKDNGVGFEMEFVEKIFGVFQRLHTQKEFEGIGIGLANTKRIILKHQGKIWTTSKEGEGATFFVQL